MAEASYTLVFQGGILSGFDREQVMQRFGQLFRLSVEEVEKVFGHPRVVLKRNLDRAAADAFVGRLADIGMSVSLDVVNAPVPATAGPTPPAEPSPTPESVSPSSPAHPAARPASVAGSGGQHSGGAETPPAISGVRAAPSVQAAPPATAAGEIRELAFEFKGSGSEYFRIWIVNLLLSIVTLGIYSAWAKVRTQRYFYGNTRCDGASFDYLADPLSILKGRLVAFGMFLLYSLAQKFAPLLGAVLALGFSLVFPWIMVRGLAFRNRNSMWRGVRFGFDGPFKEAYKVFVLWPFLGAITFGLLFPYAVYRQQRFIIENSRYGSEPFRFDARPRDVYMIALALLGVAVGGFVLFMLVGKVFPPLSPLALVATYLVFFALSNVMFTNLRYNKTTLGINALQASYELRSYAMLMLTNTVGIALTFGLFYPWAKVRSARYAAEHIAVVADGDLDEFVAEQRDNVSAVGGEIGEMFDVDFGI